MAMMKDLKSLYRNTKNTILQLPEIEIKVRDATSNEKWGPTGKQMKEIAQATHSYSDFPIIMNTIWKRINDPGRLWRHIYKSLLLLDYLLKNGSDQVLRETRVHLIEIQTLTQFQHIDEHDKDQGVNVRERAKQVVELLHDDNRLKTEREKAFKNRDKYDDSIEGGVGASYKSYNSGSYGQNNYNYGNQNYDDYSTKPPENYNEYSGNIDEEVNDPAPVVSKYASPNGPSGNRPRAPSDPANQPTQPAQQPNNNSNLNDLFTFDSKPTQQTQPNQQFGQQTQPNQQFGQPTQPFGQPTQPFGQQTQPNQQFGQPNQPFGQPNQQPNQQFGQPNQPFGQPNQPTQPNQQFGQPNQPFGNPNQSFSKPTQQTQPNQQFGQPNQQYNPFGSNNFAQPTNEDFFNPRNAQTATTQTPVPKQPETEWADFTSYSSTDKQKEDPWAQNKLFNLSNLGAKPSQLQPNKVPMGAAKPMGQTFTPFTNSTQQWGVPPANTQPNQQFGQQTQPFGQQTPFGQPNQQAGQTQPFKW